jgi:hypothetical protein
MLAGSCITTTASHLLASWSMATDLGMSARTEYILVEQDPAARGLKKGGNGEFL